jgi:hypothetical protein
MATLSFLPFVRRGLAIGIGQPDPNDPLTKLQLALTIGASAGQAAGQVTVDLTLVGPGEIAGLDPRVVVRTTPTPDESNAEFAPFAAIEFDQADLPWRYTPEPAQGGRLLPWLSLIVLAEGPGAPEAVIDPPSPTQPLPIARVLSPARLPDLSVAWAWAHAQVAGDMTSATLDAILRGRPGRVVARLLCPRRLQARTTYNAFLVPTFKRGLLAGRGESPAGTAATTLAWPSKGDERETPLRLPIYYQWRFTTGNVGGFEDLARALEPQELPASVGRRMLDVSAPGFGLPSAIPEAQANQQLTALPVEGALQSPQAALLQRPPIGSKWLTALQAFLNTSKLKVETTDGQLVEVLVVVPPLYGRWHAAQAQLASQPNPPWFFRLNSDPRDRVAAGLGTAVVQQLQDDLLGSAWRQVGNLREANQERKVLQLGREAYARQFDRHLGTLSRQSFLLLTSYLHGHVLLAGPKRTVAGLLADSPIGLDFFDPQWLRFTRPRGAIGRRQGQPLRSGAPPDLLDRLNNGPLLAPEPPTPDGMSSVSDPVCRLVAPIGLTPDQLKRLPAQSGDPTLFWALILFYVTRAALATNAGRSWWWILELLRSALWMLRVASARESIDFGAKLCEGSWTAADIATLPPSPGFTLLEELPSTPPTLPSDAPGSPDSEDARLLREALSDWVNNQHQPRLSLPLRTPVDLAALDAALKQGLAPGTTLAERHRQRFSGPAVSGWTPADDLEPIQAAPEFSQAMFGPLRDISSEWIVPGIAEVAPNTVGLLVPNQAFIEAYMVGLNHELARELLWNEFPTDQRGSYFRQFWDSAGFSAGGAAAKPEELRDITPIHTWGRSALGQHSPRRTGPGGQLVLLVRGELIRRYPNLLVYAANEAAVQSSGQPQGETHPIFSGQLGADVAFYGFELSNSQARSLFFVLQEQPGEPRFALGNLQPSDDYADPAKLAVATAAELAAKTWQQPIRVAIPGALLLGGG